MGKFSKNCQPGCASNHLQQLVHKEERYDDMFVARSHRLFSHDGKVRILNFNSKCAF